MAVVEHGAVDHSDMCVGKLLEILIVCGDHSPYAIATELSEDTLRYSGANLGFCPRAELVNKNERGGIGIAQHLFHVDEMS